MTWTFVERDDGSELVPSLALPPQLADEFLETYLSWRELCVAVQHAYERWAGAAPGDGPLAFAAYRATLDLEDHAAAIYRDCAARVSELR